MAQNDNKNQQQGRRDKRGRFTQQGAAYYGRLGGEASRNARRNRKQKHGSDMNENNSSNE